MERRKFIQSTAVAVAGIAISPHLIANNFIKYNRLVFCILGGGVRKSDVFGDVSAMPLLAKFSTQKIYDNVFYDGDEINHYAACKTLLNIDTNNKNIFEIHKQSQLNNFNYQSFFVMNQRANYASLVENISKEYQPKIIETSTKNNSLPYSNDEAVFNSAIKIIEQSKPHLLVMNLQDADVAHSNFDDYIKVLNHADNQIEKLWQTIENTDKMKGNTTFVVVTEHGRNEYENEIINQNGKGGLDHHHESAKEIFAVIRGSEKSYFNTSIDSSRITSHDFTNELMNQFYS